MVNLNGRYQWNLKYWLTCISGFVAVLTMIVVGGFYIAKPYLDSFVKQEIAHRSIRAETAEVSIIGKVNLTNVTLPVPADVSLKIGAISARPPLSFIPGTFTLYDIDLKHNNIHIKIPQISLNSVYLKKKDTKILSHILQSIMRIELSSIVAPDILLSIEDENKITEKLEIKDFQLLGFKNGHIGSVGFKNMNLNMTAKNGEKKTHIISKSDAIKAHDIDIYNYADFIIFGKKNSINQVKNVTGPISLKNLIVDISEGEEKNISLSLGTFKTSGFKMQPLEQTTENLIKAYLNEKKVTNKKTEKTARRDILINNLLAITLADAEVNNLKIDTPRFKETLESFQFTQSLWKQPIPKKLLISFNNLSILPKKMRKEDLELLKKIGIEHFDFSEKFDISYDERERTLSLNAMSFNIENIGSGKVSAKLVNVDEKLFSAQKDLMITASQDLGITDINISYTDAGFIDKLFSYLAQNLGDTKHDLKKELYDNFYLMMTQTPKILLKDHEKAENISNSLGDFAKNPQTLTIKITAKDNKGLTMVDLGTALQNDFSTVLNKVNLSVKNQSSP
ncbi:Uncharacterised protein [Candidatus Bartonella washoeensis]|uniref:Uncharacterized protein n=1 Tax=Candidatus Bartonella washoeensis Sb944nv TaxID=1094563 RepID=J1JAU7_9HYPH|nr:hypothetical protein [Bartonella washoeensis]EJF81487.1 hypothetical protein MCQ_00185 [Bartonella washoeensis Sb944nv]SPU28044.1 Uncharacterised protein [Bartonella washoeensis]